MIFYKSIYRKLILQTVDGSQDTVGLDAEKVSPVLLSRGISSTNDDCRHCAVDVHPNDEKSC